MSDAPRPRLPSFFLLGAAKAGTSAFFDLLGQQPKIFAPHVKEPNFFALGGRPPRFTGPGDDAGINRRSVWRQRDYERLFSDARPGQICGDGSVIYLPSPVAARAIRDKVPEARLIAILRDPVERALSAFQQLRRDGREPLADLRRALDAEPGRVTAGWEPLWHYARLGRYAEHLEAWFDHFSRDQVQLVRYEQLRDHPQDVLVRVCEFLDVPAVQPTGRVKQMNTSGVPRSRLLQDVLVGDGSIKQVARRVLPASVRHRAWRALMQRNMRRSRDSLPAAVEAELRDRFRPDVEALERLLGWDLAGWKERTPA